MVMQNSRAGTSLLNILGYSQSNKDDLLGQRAILAPPMLAEALPTDYIASKEMPQKWPPGERLGFSVRCCPIVRKSGGGEKDAFLAACDHVDTEKGLSREAVYMDWLAREMARNNAAEIENAIMQSFRFTRPVRKKKRGALPAKLSGKKDDPVQKSSSVPKGSRPDATFKGILRIADSEAFSALMARGLGRHRAFGFGMLLLSPAKG
jgi:CRISPR system Cascade subunit CasE